MQPSTWAFPFSIILTNWQEEPVCPGLLFRDKHVDSWDDCPRASLAEARRSYGLPAGKPSQRSAIYAHLEKAQVEQAMRNVTTAVDTGLAHKKPENPQITDIAA